MIRPLGFVREPIRAKEASSACCQEVTTKRHESSAEAALAAAGLAAYSLPELTLLREWYMFDLPVLC